MSKVVLNKTRKRSRPVIREDFNRVSKNISFEFGVFYTKRTMTELSPKSDSSYIKKGLALWNKNIPISPRQAAKILTDGLPAESKVEISLDEDGEGSLCFSGPGIDHVIASFDFGRLERYEGSMVVFSDQRGKKIGRTILRNQIEFLHTCGIKKFKVHASLSAGGYMWARFGYLPQNINDPDFERVREHVQSSLKALKNLLKEEEYKTLEEYAEFRKKEHMWRVADCRIDMVERLAATFNKASNPKLRTKKSLQIAKRVGRKLDLSRSEYFQSGIVNRQPVFLGRLLLAGTSWKGFINLDNARQMERVGAYVGGWRYIQVAGDKKSSKSSPAPCRAGLR